MFARMSFWINYQQMHLPLLPSYYLEVGLSSRFEINFTKQLYRRKEMEVCKRRFLHSTYSSACNKNKQKINKNKRYGINEISCRIGNNEIPELWPRCLLISSCFASRFIPREYLLVYAETWFFRRGSKPVLLIRIHRIHMFFGLPDPDPLVRGMDPDPDPSIIIQK